MDDQWGCVGAKSRQRWLFYAYDRIRRTVVAHVFVNALWPHSGVSSEPAVGL
ncbi:IS1 family transposase [Shigella flexneri]